MNRTQNEVLAEHHAFNTLGDFIDKAVEKHGFDIRQWPPEVFDGLARAPIYSYNEKLRDLALKDEVPF